MSEFKLLDRAETSASSAACRVNTARRSSAACRSFAWFIAVALWFRRLPRTDCNEGEPRLELAEENWRSVAYFRSWPTAVYRGESHRTVSMHAGWTPNAR